jgi:uncharacterized membrane protein YcaP (DUF421 family)
MSVLYFHGEVTSMDSVFWGVHFRDLLVPGIGIAEKIIRPVIVYLLLVIGLRIAGKREMAQLNTFDMVVLLTLSNTVQNAIIGNDNSLSGGIIGAATLLLLNYFMVRMMFKHKKLERLVEGEPDTLISGGKIRESRLQKEAISIEELSEAAHKQGIASLSEVEKAILDPDGVLSFTRKEPTTELLRHQEILDRLDRLTAAIEKVAKTNTSKHNDPKKRGRNGTKDKR